MSPPDDTPIEADTDLVAPPEESEIDAESRRESTASITSSLLEYRQVHGRTYQNSKTTEYWAPNDDKHIEAFDVAHQWITMMIGDQLFIPDIGDEPQRILDVGTGTGIWAIDMADKYPSAEVIGVDISPTQPNWVPPNCVFQIDDAQLDWTFPENHFDLIHVRYMHGAFDDWAKLYRQIYKHLKPGGWFQQIEPDIHLHCDNPNASHGGRDTFAKWAKLFYDAGDKLGRSFRLSDQDPEGNARAAGFTEVHHRTFKLPLSPWPRDKKLKEQGQYAGLYMDLSLDGFALVPIGLTLGWTPEEVQVLVAQMRGVIRNPKNMAYGDMHAFWGQKPKEPAETTA